MPASDARLLFVLLNWGKFAVHPQDFFKVWEGGMSFHGGIAGGVLAGILYMRSRHLPLLPIADAAAPGLSRPATPQPQSQEETREAARALAVRGERDRRAAALRAGAARVEPDVQARAVARLRPEQRERSARADRRGLANGDEGEEGTDGKRRCLRQGRHPW